MLIYETDNCLPCMLQKCWFHGIIINDTYLINVGLRKPMIGSWSLILSENMVWCICLVCYLCVCIWFVSYLVCICLIVSCLSCICQMMCFLFICICLMFSCLSCICLMCFPFVLYLSIVFCICPEFVRWSVSRLSALVWSVSWLSAIVNVFSVFPAFVWFFLLVLHSPNIFHNCHAGFFIHNTCS